MQRHPRVNIPSQVEDSLRALSLILVAGMHNSDLIRDFGTHKESFDEYRHAVQTARTRYTKEEQEEWLKTTANGGRGTGLAQLYSGSLLEVFMIDAAQACHGQRFFPIVPGYFGLGPAAMGGEGIFSCIFFFGATIPFILQKHDNIFPLVGEAYVHGVMSGEAIEMWKRGELEQVVFQPY